VMQFVETSNNVGKGHSKNPSKYEYENADMRIAKIDELTDRLTMLVTTGEYVENTSSKTGYCLRKAKPLGDLECTVLTEWFKKLGNKFFSQQAGTGKDKYLFTRNFHRFLFSQVPKVRLEYANHIIKVAGMASSFEAVRNSIPFVFMDIGLSTSTGEYNDAKLFSQMKERLATENSYRFPPKPTPAQQAAIENVQDAEKPGNCVSLINFIKSFL